MAKVWLITGCSSGFGHEISIAALDRGDTVVATARDISKLSDLSARHALIYQLDVTWSEYQIQSTIDAILRDTGRIDILVNNAGYILAGGIEECSREEVEAEFQTNVFGQLNIIRAVLPSMRAAMSGVVANLGSIGGWRGTPAAGIYCATKACASIIAESLRSEVKQLGIQVTAVEPGYFRTAFLSSGHKTLAKRKIKDVEEPVGKTYGALEAYDGQQPGDAKKGAGLIVEALTGTGRCEGKVLPARLVIGRDAYEIVGGYLNAHRNSLDE